MFYRPAGGIAAVIGLNEGILQNLIRQITQQVRRMESIRRLLAIDGMKFEEIGAGAVLTARFNGSTGKSTLKTKSKGK